RMVVGERVTDDKMNPDYGLTQGDRYMWGRVNTQTGEWEDTEGFRQVSCALTAEVLFADMQIYKEGVSGSGTPLRTELGFEDGGRNVMGVSKASADGRVLGLTYSAFDVVGVEHVYPLILVLDTPLTGTESIVADKAGECVVIAGRGFIEAAGGAEVSVYDLQGKLTGTGVRQELPAGVYVVRADGHSYKVRVR
ncbi:MAG: T9SS type A sorting domain-containing protein, partial [Lachnospiraceae bacterium]|nr:T9SS type A sorting domain-containing protein [Lachnospiraceae bacterium]